MLIYVSGPYSAIENSVRDIDFNIQAARDVAIALWQLGHAVICPHLNTGHMERDCTATYDQYLAGDFNMIARCDAMVMVAGWEDSRGAKAERDYALALGMPIYTEDELPPLHPTESRCPTQVAAFRETLGRMYRLHLSKNQDYSPLNIKGTGEIGCAVRAWDKVCRIMNLLGFRIDGELLGFDTPRAPNHEAVEDTWLDFANYGVIGLLSRRGQWGR